MTNEERIRQFTTFLDHARVIPAVSAPESVPAALASPSVVVYFLRGTLESIPAMTELVLRRNKVPIVNLDLAQGLARDAVAVGYLASRGVRGVISVHDEPLRAARSLGLFAIKRSFLIDSGALKSTAHSLQQFLPDALEILPAAVGPLILPNLAEAHHEIPVICGGLVSSMKQVEELVGQGVHAVSVSDEAFWTV
jgi:glycerol uptake operon antiterminator